jgi:hypothetical protein
MILLLSSFITNKRGINRFSRFDIFKYTLYSYRNLPFTELYLFILLDDEFIKLKNDLNDFIFNIFKNISHDKIHIVWNRFSEQKEWIPIIEHLKMKHGNDELIWFTQNDDHVFIDFNMDILNEGIELLKKEENSNKSLYFSHWPEIIKMSGKYEEPVLINNYIKFHRTILDSIQIFSLSFLYYIFVEYKWKSNHIRTDSIINEISSDPGNDNPLNQVIYVPLREMVIHFDGYDHVNMDKNFYPLLVLPSNTFNYEKEYIENKMIASHNSVWTDNNNFVIPKKWIEINSSLHPSDLINYTIKLEDEKVYENFVSQGNDYSYYLILLIIPILFLIFYRKRIIKKFSKYYL